MRIHIATSREVGKECIEWASLEGYDLVPMDECEFFISVMYDKIIPEEFIKTRRCFNIHPGILPWYRGAGAYSWVLINGEMEAGVTLHEIDKDIDHGKVIEIRRFPIGKKDTAESLFSKAEETIVVMFKEWLPNLIAGNYGATDQDEGRIYYRKDLEKAKDLTRFVRAFTFEGKENAYYFKSDGSKVYLEL